MPPREYAIGGGRPYRVSLAYGGDAWLITGYHAARTVLADTSFSSDSTRPDYPNFPLASRHRIPGHFLSMDPPEHTRLRRTVAADFTAQGLKALRPTMEAVAVELVEAMARQGPPADLIDGFAIPLHGRLVAELLGVPAGDRPFFQACARALQLHDASAAQRMAAGGRMNQYLNRLILTRRASASAGADVLSRLAMPQSDGGQLGLEDAVGVANLILVAGLETTVGLLGLTVLALLRDRAQGDLVRADPRSWAAAAVRESLRYWTVVHHGVARVATRDVEVSEQPIRAGESVVVHLPTANRDPEVYPDPDAFDIARDAQGHLAFGHGPHRCLGGTLAQLEVSAAIEVLAGRLPGMRLLDPAAEASFLHHMLVYGVRELRVAW